MGKLTIQTDLSDMKVGDRFFVRGLKNPLEVESVEDLPGKVKKVVARHVTTNRTEVYRARPGVLFFPRLLVKFSDL